MMLVAERQQKIVDLVNQHNSVRVSELSKLFSVTEETVRRDLEKLENQKMLVRSHGGAVNISKSASREIPYFEREIMHVEEKKQIALEAIKHIHQGDKIILDASSTAWYMAKKLPNIPLTVMTNSIKVAMELSQKNEITVISTGGILLSKSLSYVGSLAESSFESYHLDKAFVSCKGLHLDKGLSESDEQQAKVKKRMIESVNTVFIMLDYSKFNKIAFSKICDTGEIDYILTDAKTDESTIQHLSDKGLTVSQMKK